MSEQPEALRLADCVTDLDYTTRVQAFQAALCLRRLHEESRQHREVMRLALEALEAMQAYAAAERKGLRICDEAITALRAALGEKE
jgi:hypothetical protein